MKEGIEEIFHRIVKISQSNTVIDLKIVEKTKSILKARLYFAEELFVQVYVNTRKPKKSYTLILNDRRILPKTVFLINGISTPLKIQMSMTNLKILINQSQ